MEICTITAIKDANAANVLKLCKKYCC